MMIGQYLVFLMLLCFFQDAVSLLQHPQRTMRYDNNWQTSMQKPTVTIEYCTGCRWLLRSAYYAQELLTTFEQDLNQVALKPNSDKPGGVFLITVNTGKEKEGASVTIWDRKNDATAGFPETKVLKQRLRDVISPTKNLGHSEAAVIEIPPE